MCACVITHVSVCERVGLPINIYHGAMQLVHTPHSKANCPLLAMHVAARACAWPRVDALTQQHPALAPWAAVLHGQVHVSKEQQVGGVDQAVNKPMLVNELESLGLQHMW